MSEIRNLEPKAVWEYFYQLTQIPRPSNQEEAIQAFMVQFGEGLGLETIKDEVGNVIIRKPATPGMENRQGVILQSHLDMVPQANSDKEHDFTKDPISAFVDGEWVTADGTTLGADNGMGAAAAMAVLASKDMVHGPVEGLFTATEETGMNGAFGLQPGVLQGEILLNMDSEDEGELYVGCAGGMDGNFSFAADTDSVPAGYVAFAVSVKGLKGGHSGMDIILERGNANKILFRFLYAHPELEIKLGALNGGSLRNAIPREAFATFVLPAAQVPAFEECWSAFEKVVQKELASADPDLELFHQTTDVPAAVLTKDVQERLTRAVYACPNGVIRMSQDMPGLVETSTNLAVVKWEGEKISLQCLLRSSVDSAKQDLAQAMQSVFELAGAQIEFSGEYAGWQPNMDSGILKVMQGVYEKMTGNTPAIKAIHAGLECGILGGIYPGWDMISFGPTIRFPHSPDEKVKIDTVAVFFKWLQETLKQIPVK